MLYCRRSLGCLLSQLDICCYPKWASNDSRPCNHCRERSERLYNKDHSISMVYPVAHAPCVNNSRTGWDGGEGWGGVQILCRRTPPRRLISFKKRLCRVNAGSEEMVYVYFQNPTSHRDFTITVFLIIWLRRQSRGKVAPGLGSRAGLFSSQMI